MQFDDLLRLFRTRWYVIVAVTATFVVLTWALVPSRLASSGAARFEATTTLVATSSAPSSARGQPNILSTYSLIATQGRVPGAVADQLGVSVDDLLARVSVFPSIQTNSLSVGAVDRTSQAASGVSDLVANELVKALNEDLLAERAAAKASLAAQVEDLDAEAGRLATQAPNDPGARAAFEATSRQLNAQRVKLSEMEGSSPEPPLRLLGPASIKKVSQSSAADKLLALPVRTFLALLLGLGGSIGVLLMADRFDVRLHTKEAVEVAFGLPVLAEVPVLPRKLRRGIAVADAPETAFAEAHRILRTAVETSRLALGGEAEVEQHRPRIVVVTSADPGEGKTTTAVNLAASFAEAGRSTLVVGADLRHADLQEVVRGPLRADFVSIGATSDARRPVQVRIAASGFEQLRAVSVEPPLGRPPVVLPLLGAWIVGMRDEVDVVVVDTPPLLVCNDASELLPVADAVLVVCRAGGTTAEAADRCTEVLTRLRAKVIGVVMVGAPLRTPVRKVYGYGPAGLIRAEAGAPPAEASPGAPDLVGVERMVEVGLDRLRPGRRHVEGR